MIKRISFQYTGKLTYEQVSEKFKQLNQLKQIKMGQAKTIKAIFQGQNGSCGFEHGKTYNLFIDHKPGGNISVFDTDEAGVDSNSNIIRKSATRQCEYETMVGFLNNWVLQSQLFESNKSSKKSEFEYKINQVSENLKEDNTMFCLIESKEGIICLVNGKVEKLITLVGRLMNQSGEIDAIIQTADKNKELIGLHDLLGGKNFVQKDI